MANVSEKAFKLLSLMIKDKGCADKFFSSGNDGKIFADPSLSRICSGLSWSADESKPLTRDRFEHYLRVIAGEAPASISGVLGTFDALTEFEVDSADFDHILAELRDQFLQREFRELIKKLKADGRPGFKTKLSDFSDGLSKLVSSEADGIFDFFDTKDVYEGYVDRLEHKAKNPESRITCGIREIDDCMTIGFKPGTLTLTVADVGGGKSTMMLNIAFNLFKRGHNVLFLPLEMPFDDIYAKFLSRECMIEFEKIAKPEMLSVDEWKIIRSHKDKVHESRGGLMWADVKSRPTVQEIKHAIDRKMPFFKPAIVVIDYAANIKLPQNDRHDLEIGYALKDLRNMGKSRGFAVLSAAQLSRDGIKKLKNEKEGGRGPGSEDLRGSHEYSADADNIFVQAPSPDEPNRKMLLYCIKARWGKKVFDGGKNCACLDWFPEYCKVDSGTSGSLDVSDPTIAAMVDSISSLRNKPKNVGKSADDWEWLDM